jgi:RNA polymerase sigma-70 factor (ECF subfamily)
VTDLADAWRIAIRDARAGEAEPELVAHVRAAIAGGGVAAHAADVVLAWAVAQRDREAVARFEREVAPEIAAGIRRVDRDRAFVDEVTQRVRVRLLVGDDSAPPRIASYRGTGPLRGWVAIVALRTALNAVRDRAPDSAGDDVLGDVVDREDDPELRHLRTLYRSELREALSATLGELPDRDRALLRMRFVAGLELAKIGALYRVHESTASRWIAATLDRVRHDARERLVAQLAIGPGTADSVARLVASRLDLSIVRLLQ